MNSLPPKPEKLTQVGIDWDNTIFNTSGYPDYLPTEIIKGAKEELDKIVKIGLQVVIFTARPWSDLYIIEHLVKKYDLPVSSIICGKPLFLCLIDDKNIEFKGEWNGIAEEVKYLKVNE